MLAPAKLNLLLHVAGKRYDGLHPLFSLVAFASVGDDLTLSADSEGTLTVTGPHAMTLADLPPDRNIIDRAKSAVFDWSARNGRNLPDVSFELIKHLPVAAGLGGGSSDAAGAIKLLIEHFQLRIPAQELLDLAMGLGADIPVCLAGRPSWVFGIGEEISAAPVLPDCHVVLVNPGIELSTADVFTGFDASQKPAVALLPDRLPCKFERFEDLVSFLRQQRNDLEPVAMQLVPRIGDVLAEIRKSGAAISRMSGSGATCFGLYSSGALARKAAEALRLRYSTWWIDAACLMRE